jgi:hypothetical protein
MGRHRQVPDASGRRSQIQQDQKRMAEIEARLVKVSAESGP